MACKRRGNALRWWGDANTKLRWACCSGNCGATCSSTAETAASVCTSRDSALANCIGTLLIKKERNEPPFLRWIVVLSLVYSPSSSLAIQRHADADVIPGALSLWERVRVRGFRGSWIIRFCKKVALLRWR